VRVWRWYDAVVLGEQRDSLRLWEPAHGEVVARRRRVRQPHEPGTRAYLSAGLPGAEWWVAGRAVARAETPTSSWTRSRGSTRSGACGTPHLNAEQRPSPRASNRHVDWDAGARRHDGFGQLLTVNTARSRFTSKIAGNADCSDLVIVPTWAWDRLPGEGSAVSRSEQSGCLG
jgi:hypothetical protein